VAEVLLFYHPHGLTSGFGDGWPPGVPVQVPGMDTDPIFVEEGIIDAARPLVATAADADA